MMASYLAHRLLLYLAIIGCGFVLRCGSQDGFGEKHNQCEMTYMWRKNGELTGLPVIFVPGTAGSGRQVRSLGSMLQNKTDLRESPFHFDTFAVDFNEELTAISAEYLVIQSKYLSSAIEHVWSLYTKKPPGIVLVGHSMGGIVIQKCILLHPNFDKSKILMVISLATPYNEPPYLFDKSFLHLWLSLNRMSERYSRSESPQIPFVSISGGLKDEFIEEEWTASKHHLHTSTTAIDRVNLEMDHRCIIWCNQLVRHISRVLFDYAESPINFLKNPVEKLRLHYKGAGPQLQPFVPSDPQIFSPADCVPQCPSVGMLSLVTSSKTTGQQYLLVLSHHTNTQLVGLECPVACSTIGLTRFLGDEVLYSFLQLADFPKGSTVKVKLEGTKSWLLDKSKVVMPKKSLSFMETFSEFLYGSAIPMRVSVENGLKILPIEFVHAGAASSVVYRMRIQGNECREEGIRRVVFFQNNAVSRMTGVDAVGNFASLTIYESKERGKEAMLVFINDFECNYDIYFQVDYGYTIIKAIRRYRHAIPSSVIIAIITLYAGSQIYFSYAHYLLISVLISFCVGMSSWSSALRLDGGPFTRRKPLDLPLVRSLLDARFGEIVSVILLTDFAFISIFYLLFRLILLPVLTFLNSVKWLSLSALWKLVVLAVIVSISLFTHSLFVAIGCTFFNLLSMVAGRTSNFGRSFAIISLQLLVILMQIPSFVAYFWNLKAYNQIYAHYDPFFEANTLVLLFCVGEAGLCLFRKPLPSKYFHLLKTLRYIFASILQLSCFVCIFLVVYRNGICSYQVLDDLCVLCAAILGILWRPGAVV